MQINPEGNYYPDRTYSNNAGRGVIKVKKNETKNIAKFKEKGSIYKTNSKCNRQCFIRSLISTRKISIGYIVVVIRQPKTANDSYALAKEFQVQAKEELRKNNYFLNDYDGFLNWFEEKEKVLKENGFHKLKG